MDYPVHRCIPTSLAELMKVFLEVRFLDYSIIDVAERHNQFLDICLFLKLRPFPRLPKSGKRIINYLL